MPKKKERTTSEPLTLAEAIQFFADPDRALNYAVRHRWPDGVKCPYCGSEAVIFLRNQRRWKCGGKHPRRQFSVKVGTIMEDSPIGLDKWFTAMWMASNCKNGVSSYEIARALDITQKSAWFMLQRIRLSMQDPEGGGKLGGTVEVDETYIGGKARNMHKSRREAKKIGPGIAGKAAVMGLLKRHGKGGPSQVIAHVVTDTTRAVLQGKVRAHVERGSKIMSDEHSGYTGLSADFEHEFVNHAEAYVVGNVHTNGIENFWSLLKRGLRGTYVSVEPFHLFRYVDEQAFRFNHRKDERGDLGRFSRVASQVAGKRLTYRQLIGDKTEPSPAASR